MNSVKELRRLLFATPKTQTGEVLSFTSDTVTVKLGSGVQVLKNNGSLYSAGASVLVRDSTVLGLVRPENKIPQYWL